MLRRATGQSNADYLESRIWQPLGMQDDALWVTDDEGKEFAAGGAERQLYLHRGSWNGQQVVPSAGVMASVTPDAPI